MIDLFDPIAYINTPRWQTVSLGLERIVELLHLLGDPQNELRFVHIAGTNGKGSTAALIASVLVQANYRTGLFTSPYIYRFEERIRVNGVEISPEDLFDITVRVRDAAEAMAQHPTEFELMTAVGLCYFKACKCDLVVIEVGLGGRLDSTNVISTVEVCVITPISKDHCDLLGDTLTDIALEKAGIIKPGVPVISAPQSVEVAEVLAQKANENASLIRFVADDAISGNPDDFSYKSFSHLKLSLKAHYQLVNACVALEAISVLRDHGWTISDNAIRQGFASCSWPGRYETISETPRIILDGAHNEAGIEALLSSLTHDHPRSRLIFLVGMLADKDYEKVVLRLCGLARSTERASIDFIVFDPPNPRACKSSVLANLFLLTIAEMADNLSSHTVPTSVENAHSPEHALRCALDLAQHYQRIDSDYLMHDSVVICACGSLYSLSALKKAFEQNS